MSIVAFDTLKFANQLQAGNFTPEQAQAMTAAMVEAMAGAELATKSDLTLLEHRLEKKIDSVIADAEATKAELKADIAAVRADAEATKAELKADIAASEHRLEQKISESQISTQRFILTGFLSAVGINAVMILGAMFGLAKLLGH